MEKDIGLIYKVANHLIKKDELCRKVIGTTADEYLGVGYLALKKAQKNFDINKKYKFSTYACKVIKDQIVKYARKNSTLIKIASSYRYQAWRVVNGKTQTNGNAKGVHAVMKILNSKVENINPNIKTIREEEQDWINSDLINEYINLLQGRIKDIIILRYGLDGNKPKTLKEVGILLKPKLSRERVRQLEKQGLQKLKKALLYNNHY